MGRFKGQAGIVINTEYVTGEVDCSAAILCPRGGEGSKHKGQPHANHLFSIYAMKLPRKPRKTWLIAFLAGEYVCVY